MDSSRLISEQNSEYKVSLRNDIENIEFQAALLESQKEYYNDLEIEIPKEPVDGICIKFNSSKYPIPNRIFSYEDILHSIYAYIEVYLYKNYKYTEELTLIMYPNIKLENSDAQINTKIKSKRVMLLLSYE